MSVMGFTAIGTILLVGAGALAARMKFNSDARKLERREDEINERLRELNQLIAQREIVPIKPATATATSALVADPPMAVAAIAGKPPETDTARWLRIVELASEGAKYEGMLARLHIEKRKMRRHRLRIGKVQAIAEKVPEPDPDPFPVGEVFPSLLKGKRSTKDNR